MMDSQAMDIPVVIAAYNRETVLERLLGSLLKARYDVPVKLIICIDGGGAPEVVRVAERFVWPHGEKQIIVQERNIGLRRHILFCGGLSSQHDGVILLEDDLYVSPWYYQYAQRAAQYYRESPEISGIALYSPRFNECARLPFYPLDDGSDVFFMQVACSWGQLWLKRQWEEFASWYAENASIELGNDSTLPFEIRQWPESSWKKYFIKYLVASDTFFVYPRFSLTTNFGDVGQHHTGTSLHQVPLFFGEKENVQFVDFSQSVVKYDAFGEILPETLSRLCPHLDGADFVVDLYGIKERHCFTKSHVLTSRSCDNYLQSFGRKLIPVEYNVVDAISGDLFFFSRVNDVNDIDETDFRNYIYTKCATIEEQMYFYNISNLHYFIMNKEIKKYKSMYSMGQAKIGELMKNVSNVQTELAETKYSLSQSRKSIDLIRKSLSYQIGQKIIYPFSLIKKNFMNKGK